MIPRADCSAIARSVAPGACAGHRAGVTEAEVDVLVTVHVDEAAAAGLGHVDGEAAGPLRHPVHRHTGEQVLPGARGELPRAWVLGLEAGHLAGGQLRQPVVQGHARLIARTVAFQEPRGASTSTTSPTAAPISERPSGESGDTPPTAEIVTSIVSPCSSTISTIEPAPTCSSVSCSTTTASCRRVPKLGDARLEHALLVLGGVVLEVLREVAERAGDLDRLDRGRAPRALELGQLRLELGVLLRRHHLVRGSAIAASASRDACTTSRRAAGTDCDRA